MMEGDSSLVDDFLNATHNLTRKLPSADVSRPAPRSVREIALELAERSPTPPIPYYHAPTPLLSPQVPSTPPEWDLDDPWDGEDFEIFAANQEDTDEPCSPRTPPLQRDSAILAQDLDSIPEESQPYLLRPITTPTPEDVSFLSALDISDGHAEAFASLRYSPVRERGAGGSGDPSGSPSQNGLRSRHLTSRHSAEVRKSYCSH